MRHIRILLTTLSLMLCFVVHAVPKTEEGVTEKQNFRLRYVINIAELDSTFVDNNQRMLDIREFLANAAKDSLIQFTGVDFRGTASPDGSYEFNVWLSENRLRTFKDLVKTYIDIPDSIIYAQSSDIPWDEFRAAVVNDPDVPMRETVLEIIDQGPKLVGWFGNRHIDHRLLKLKKLDGGKVWDYLKKPILFDLRYGDATFYYKRLFPNLGEITLPMYAMEPAMTDLLPMPVLPQLVTWTPNIHLKTNLIGWVMGSVNLAAEFDLAPHWSFSVPVYYCAWDYFKSTIKFRNFTIQPELRYWPNAKGYNHGFFVGAHFGMMYYNFAVDGSTRFQDYRGRTPALGGGIGIGFRKAISKNQRWHIEFAAGAGVYRLDYSKFHNTPDVKDGYWYDRKKKTFIGLDQAAVTLTYSFPLSRYTKTWQKGGEL